MRRLASLLSVLALALGVLAPLAPGAAAKEASPLVGHSVATGIPGPIDIAILPDGTMWWNEYYTGNVTRMTTDGARTTMFHADPMPKRDERGLVGLGIDAQSAAADRFFVYYSVNDPADPMGGTNHLSRIDGGKETILLTTTAAFRHNGGRILIQPDRSLFVSVGEANKGYPAQDPATTMGKILHMDQDGKPVAGNMQGLVYDVGHRNVYGLAYDKDSGRLFGTENSNAERDEVNEILPGHNYGWPTCEGYSKYSQAEEHDLDTPCDNPDFTPPLGEFYESRTAAPTGAAILHGVLYWASWNEGSIHRLLEGKDGKWTDEVVYKVGGRINDLEAAPDGSGLYYANWTDIVKVDFPQDATQVQAVQGNSPPPVATAQPTGGGTEAAKKGTPGFAGLMAAAAVVGVALRKRRST